MTDLSQIPSFIDSIIADRKKRAEKLLLVCNRLDELIGGLRDFRQKAGSFHGIVADEASLVQEAERCDQDLAQTREKCARVAARWSKESITIGVAGKPRQGKSQLLQAITGLDNNILPTSTGPPTTGARSRVSSSAGETSATVHFLTEAEFVSGIVAEYYKDIGLPNTPRSWREFCAPLPPLPAEVTQKQKNYYDKLTDLHEARHDFGPLLGSDVQTIRPDEIIEYVSQLDHDDGSKRRNYLAVKEVDIQTTFPDLSECKFSVIDLPGLGEIARGHAAKLVETLEKEADAVLYLKLPPDTGGHWEESDIAVFDCINSAIDQMPLHSYLYLILNERQDGNNAKSLEGLLKSLPSGTEECPVFRIVALDQKQVRDKLFIPLLRDEFKKKLPAFDDHLRKECDLAVTRSLDNVARLTRAMESQIDTSSDDGVIKYNQLRRSFLKKLRKEFEELLTRFHPEKDNQAALSRSIQLKEQLINELTASLHEVAESGPEFHGADLEMKRYNQGGWFGVVEDELHSMRSFFTLQLAKQLESRFNNILNDIRYEVIDLVTGGELAELLSSHGPCERIDTLIDLAQGAKAVRIQEGLEFVKRMSISYHSQIHPRIRQQLARLDPLNSERIPNEILGASENSGDTPRDSATIAKALRAEWAEVCHRVDKPLKEICQTIPWGVFATMEECKDRLVRGDGIDDEWDLILYGRRHRIWEEEYGEVKTKLEWADLCRSFIDRFRPVITEIDNSSVVGQ